MINHVDGRYFLRDTGSKNGTLLNKKRIKEKEIKVGDRIRIGAAELELDVLDKGSQLNNDEVHGDILFDKVSFQYGSEMSPVVLSDVSLQIKEGETVASFRVEVDVARPRSLIC